MSPHRTQKLVHKQNINLIGVSFNGSQRFSDKYSHLLKRLKNLTTVDFGGIQITDASLKELSELTQLTSLNLYRTEITDAGLKRLCGIKILTTLNLSFTQIGDAGLMLPVFVMCL